MQTVLIISPRFPPTSAPDSHRVRLSLPHFAEFGWRPVVLAVDPREVPGAADPLLLETVPAATPVHCTGALPLGLTRRLGIGDLALRAWPWLYLAGRKLLRLHRPALVYFSTTAFFALPLGRLWKRHSNIPFVLDIQDPWASDYPDRRAQGFSKHSLARWLHRRLEAWTMEQADGLLAVSGDYLATLHRRYPPLAARPALTLPFGAAATDFELLRRHPQPNSHFAPGDGLLHGVYVGRGGADMEPALRIIFGALRRGLVARPALFERLRLHFVGTDYASDERARKTVEPVARALGVERFVCEQTARVPYFAALQLLRDADFLLVPGSDDPQYTASKIYPYVMARRPLLAVFHSASSVVQLLRDTGAGVVVPLEAGAPSEDSLLAHWIELLSKLPFVPATRWAAFEPYSAREMTRQQCALFDEVLAQQLRLSS